MKKFDYVVVGGGLAGLYTAYFLSRSGQVALIARASLEDSNSYYAQGGIAAVTDQNDTPQDHYTDTMEAGRGLCLPSAVKTLTEEAPKRIDELIGMGMHFDTEGNALALGLEGGHHHKRILHAGGDATGRMVSTFMIEKIRKAGDRIKIFDHHIVFKLIKQNNVCRGLWAYNEAQHTVEPFVANATVLASGGACALYAPTTNPPTALGDGLALAYEVGADLMDLEFVQFHPTALYSPAGSAFLISEAVRGEGAYLLNKHGQRFMLNKHPLAELAPRDTVARAIFEQMKQDQQNYVTLSLKHLEAEHIRHRFPTIAGHCQRLGLDLACKIPVAPAAHYTVGGIRTDLNGATSIPGLYAVGEVASTGVMGANRLASNSLIECIVFGKRIAEFAPTQCRWQKENPTEEFLSPILDLSSPSDCHAWRDKQGAESMHRLGELMMKYVGIIRREDKLTQVIKEIQKGMDEIAPYMAHNVYALLAYRRHQVALLIAQSAKLRTESRGGHYREDFPQTTIGTSVYRTHINTQRIAHIPL